MFLSRISLFLRAVAWCVCACYIRCPVYYRTNVNVRLHTPVESRNVRVSGAKSRFTQYYIARLGALNPAHQRAPGAPGTV